jgi:hypothetical protein
MLNNDYIAKNKYHYKFLSSQLVGIHRRFMDPQEIGYDVESSEKQAVSSGATPVLYPI